jgi:hypothetical protein
MLPRAIPIPGMGGAGPAGAPSAAPYAPHLGSAPPPQFLAVPDLELPASTPEAFGKFIDEQSVKWAKVVKENNIRAGE